MPIEEVTCSPGSDPEYEHKIEFAVKLGYTEEQLQLALAKLGLQHTQNDLLAELIKLGSLAKGEPEYEATTGTWPRSEKERREEKKMERDRKRLKKGRHTDRQKETD